MSDPAPQQDSNPFRRLVTAGAKRPARAKRERKPRPPVGRKKDLSSGLTMAWAMAGGALELRGEPAGRLMQVQAPSAGRELNRWVKDHDLIYRAMAPFFGAQEITLLSKVFGPPLLVTLIHRKPELANLFRPLLVPMLWELYKDLKKVEGQEQEMMDYLMASAEVDPEERAGFMKFLDMLSPEPENDFEAVPVEEPEPEVAPFGPEDSIRFDAARSAPG